MVPEVQVRAVLDPELVHAAADVHAPEKMLWSFNHNRRMAEGGAWRRRNPYVGRAPRLPVALFEDALRDGSRGILIAVDVRPGATETRITGYNGWRRAVTVDVAAPPERGAANRELEAFFSRIGGGGSTARIVGGATSRHKTVLVTGVPRPRLASLLQGELR